MWRIYPRFTKDGSSGFRSMPRIVLLFSALVSFATASANEFELSRIANEISMASSYLAQDLKYSRGFGSVGQRADRLARDSAQLVDAIARRRSPSYIRSQYADVSGRYGDLEEAFFRASRNYSNEQVYDQVNVISVLFSDLSSVYYYSPIYTSRTPVVTFVNPVIVQRQTFLPNVSSDHNGRLDTRRDRNSDPSEYRSSRDRNAVHQGAVVERLRWVEERHASGQRILRNRTDHAVGARQLRPAD